MFWMSATELRLYRASEGRSTRRSRDLTKTSQSGRRLSRSLLHDDTHYSHEPRVSCFVRQRTKARELYCDRHENGRTKNVMSASCGNYECKA